MYESNQLETEYVEPSSIRLVCEISGLTFVYDIMMYKHSSVLDLPLIVKIVDKHISECNIKLGGMFRKTWIHLLAKLHGA
jgi:hypothetical protein